jgi:hypothetical protein
MPRQRFVGHTGMFLMHAQSGMSVHMLHTRNATQSLDYIITFTQNSCRRFGVMADANNTSGSNGSGNNKTTETINVLNTLPSPRDFYELYVKQRKPVVLRKCWTQLRGKCDDTIPCLETLISIVDPKALVEVNQRSDTVDSFSPEHSKVVQLEFGDFVSKLQTSTIMDYYMTTQTLPVNEEGRPELHTTPMSELFESSNCAMRPDLLGNLIPVTYNLWMGATSTAKTSSGLHHDYHDNLYCIWDGCKTMQLAPPQCVLKCIKTQGTLLKLHDNGRIVYDEQVDGGGGMIRPDGALEQVERIMELQIRQEIVERQLDIDPDNVKLEEELEQIQDELLDIECDDEIDSAEGGSFQFGVNSKDGRDGNSDSDEIIDSQDEEDQTERDQKYGKGEVRSEGPHAKKCKLNNSCESRIPLNFATDVPTDVAFETVQLEKDDLLYLPAGWFHNVFSEGNKKNGGIHMAMNYWMHPPDTGGTFEKPYLSEFWRRDWDSRFRE